METTAAAVRPFDDAAAAILDRSADLTAASVNQHSNASLIGGDVNGGANDLRQLLFRPVPP